MTMKSFFQEGERAILGHAEPANGSPSHLGDIQMYINDGSSDNSADILAWLNDPLHPGEPSSLAGGADYGAGIDLELFGGVAEDTVNAEDDLSLDVPIFDIEEFLNSRLSNGDMPTALREFTFFSKLPPELKIKILMLSITKRPIIIENEDAKYSVKSRGGCPAVLMVCTKLRDLLKNVHIFDIQAPEEIRLRNDVPDVVYFTPSADELFFVNRYSGGANGLLSWAPVKCREKISRVTVIGGEQDIWYWNPFMELAFGLHNLGKLEEVVFGMAIMPWEMDEQGGIDEYGQDPNNPKQFKGPIGDMWFAPVKRLFPEWKEPRIVMGKIRNNVRADSESLLPQDKTLEERWEYWKIHGPSEGQIVRVCNSFEDFKQKCKDEEVIEESTVTVESVQPLEWPVCTCYSTNRDRERCKCRTV